VAEIVDPATPPLRPSRNSLPLLDCLSAGFCCLLLLSVGATIAYVGMLVSALGETGKAPMFERLTSQAMDL